MKEHQDLCLFKGSTKQFSIKKDYPMIIERRVLTKPEISHSFENYHLNTRILLHK